MREKLLNKLLSRKLWAFLVCVAIVFLDAFGAGDFPVEVRTAAAMGLVAYIAAQGASDVASKNEK